MTETAQHQPSHGDGDGDRSPARRATALIAAAPWLFPLWLAVRQLGEDAQMVRLFADAAPAFWIFHALYFGVYILIFYTFFVADAQARFEDPAPTIAPQRLWPAIMLGAALVLGLETLGPALAYRWLETTAGTAAMLTQAWPALGMQAALSVALIVAWSTLGVGLARCFTPSRRAVRVGLARRLKVFLFWLGPVLLAAFALRAAADLLWLATFGAFQVSDMVRATAEYKSAAFGWGVQLALAELLGFFSIALSVVLALDLAGPPRSARTHPPIAPRSILARWTEAAALIRSRPALALGVFAVLTVQSAGALMLPVMEMVSLTFLLWAASFVVIALGYFEQARRRYGLQAVVQGGLGRADFLIIGLGGAGLIAWLVRQLEIWVLRDAFFLGITTYFLQAIALALAPAVLAFIAFGLFGGMLTRGLEAERRPAPPPALPRRFALLAGGAGLTMLAATLALLSAHAMFWVAGATGVVQAGSTDAAVQAFVAGLTRLMQIGGPYLALWLALLSIAQVALTLTGEGRPALKPLSADRKTEKVFE